jgi:hypothetical protein
MAELVGKRARSTTFNTREKSVAMKGVHVGRKDRLTPDTTAGLND